MSRQSRTDWAKLLGATFVALGAAIGGPALADTFAIKCGSGIFTVDTQASTVTFNGFPGRAMPAVITPTTIDFTMQFTNFKEVWHVDRVTEMMHDHLEIPNKTTDHDYTCKLIEGF
jgi:hypothetical protein